MFKKRFSNFIKSFLPPPIRGNCVNSIMLFICMVLLWDTLNCDQLIVMCTFVFQANIKAFMASLYQSVTWMCLIYYLQQTNVPISTHNATGMALFICFLLTNLPRHIQMVLPCWHSDLCPGFNVIMILCDQVAWRITLWIQFVTYHLRHSINQVLQVQPATTTASYKVCSPNTTKTISSLSIQKFFLSVKTF